MGTLYNIRCGGEASAGHQNTVSEHGPARTVPDPDRNEEIKMARSAAPGLTRCRVLSSDGMGTKQR